jgi:Cd2+/Zn2+-exporting ATPase
MTASTLTPRPTRARLALMLDGVTPTTSPQAIESALADLPAVSATADPATHTLHVEFDRTHCALPEIAARLDRLGLRFRPSHAPPPPKPLRHYVARLIYLATHHRELACAIIGGALLIAAVANNLAGGPALLRYVLVGSSFLIAGYYTILDTFRILANLRFDIDVLMVAAAFGAALLGHYEEGAFLLFLFALGGAGEQLAMERARSNIEALAKLAPENATVRDPATGADRTVHVSQLRPDDLVVVRPFDRLPADGVVHSGSSAVDQSPITGESVPVDKHPGDTVYAGTINGGALLLVAVTKPAAETTLAKIVRLVQEAQATKSPTQRFTEKVEIWYVPFVLIATALLIVIPPLVTGAWSTWFYRAMAFLTAASPCALAIGTPAAVLSGIARAARLGVLVKGGAHLENLGRIQVIALDKTGTLTRGRPTVTDIVPVSTQHSELSTDTLLRLTAAAERTSSHPLAQAIVAAALDRHIEVPDATDAEQIPGQGLTATVDGRTVRVGRPSLLRDSAPADLLAATARLAAEGKTIVAVTIDGVPAGVIALADRPRHNAADALARLKRLGLTRTIMLTGDHAPVAKQIASTLPIDEFHADLMPADKLTIVRELQDRYGPLAMVGDGVNDAPALAAATVGIAMGSAGTDVAIETADVALMGDDLQKLPDAIGLSRFSRRIVHQNLVIALGVISVLAPLSALGYTYLGVAVLFHEGSTVVVVLNALRLLAYKPR